MKIPWENSIERTLNQMKNAFTSYISLSSRFLFHFLVSEREKKKEHKIALTTTKKNVLFRSLSTDKGYKIFNIILHRALRINLNSIFLFSCSRTLIIFKGLICKERNFHHISMTINSIRIRYSNTHSLVWNDQKHKTW